MGMNRKYRESGEPYRTKQTGSVAKWMGLSDEGIRLYERHGLIHPEKDEQNKYRAFDIMVAVGTLIQHIQGQIQFCICRFI